jgi:hypothetical protein
MFEFLKKKQPSPLADTTRDLTGKDIINANLNIKGWTPATESSQSGCIVWSHPKSKNVIYATPNWDEPRLVPFEISDYDDGGNSRHIMEIKFNVNTTTEEQLSLYTSTIETVIKFVPR